MDPRDPDELGNTTEPEEETFALQRKRSRRVSFADITSVLVFDRDEDFETPPDQKSAAELSESEKLDGSVGFQTDIGGRDDSKVSSRREDDGEAEEEEDGQALFVQNMDFSSPGSVAGSLTSNDEESFFGPVSTKFIRSGRLSTESADSGNQQDVTLDSTAFSLHFRNLVKSSDRFSPSQHFLTPTKLPLELDKETPTGESRPTTPGILKVLTGKKLVTRSSSAGKSSNCDEYSEMSLMVTDSNRYDYGKISPELEALLAESVSELQPSCSLNKDHSTVSSKDSGNMKNTQPFDDNSSARMPSGEGHSNYGNCTPIIKVTVPADANGVHRDHMHSESFEAAPSFQENESNNNAHLLQAQLGAVNRDITLSPLKKDRSLDGLLNHVQNGTENNNYLLQSSPLPLPRTPTLHIATNLERSSASLKDGRYAPKFAVELGCGSPLSVSSLRAKGRQLFHDSAVLSLNDCVSSPPTKQHFSSLNKEDTKYGDSLSSMRKKFLNFEVSETQEIEVGSAKASFPGSAKKTSSSQDFLENHAANLKLKQAVSVTSLGGNDASDNADRNINLEVEIEHCGGTGSVLDETTSTINTGALCSTENGRLIVEPSSIHQVSDSENNSLMQTLKDTESSKKLPLTSLPYSLPTQTTPTPFRTLNQTDQLDDLHASPRVHRQDVVKIECHTTPLTPGTASYPLSSALCKKSIQQLSKSLAEADQALLHGLQQKPESSGGYQTPLDCGVTIDLHSGCYERTIDAKIGLAMPGRSHLHKRGLHASFIDSSAITLGMTSTSLQPDEVINNMQHTRGKDTYHITEKDSPNAVHLKALLSPKAIGVLRVHDSNNTQRSLQSYKRSFSIYNVDSSGSKVSEDWAPSELHSVDGQNSGQKRWKTSPQLEHRFIESASELSTVNHCEVGKVNREQLLDHWKDVCSRIPMTAKKFLPTSVDFLNPKELSKLQDRLSLLEEVKKYEKFHDEIKSQAVDSHGDQVQHQKAIEARWLLHKLMHEQAKHCLLKLQRDRLHKSYQQLHSEFQECHALKDHFLQHQRGGTGDSQTRVTWLTSVSAESDSENQEAHQRVTVMKQELALLDESIKRKVASFHVSCNINGSIDNEEIISLVTDFVQKHTYHRDVLKYLQLWELEDICKKDGQQTVILNYSGLLSQRFTMNAASVSSIFLFNQWNDEKIKQSFPTVNASTLFEFVFGQKGGHMKCGPNSFRKQTQITSFLLGNLLDVVMEVRQAQMEISNLAHVSFHSPCADLLQLHLCFVDFGTGRKVKVILDMTDLVRAVYPSEIDPSQLQIEISGQQPPLVSEIADAACNLEAGHCMILRFCWHVSQLVKALRC
ncbi:uncharacterized protein [Aristolochia californica]|uniref:uncharacterized protein n=1 Tax=Aristolochia californica TaxID=171875 RepID=UPI0035E1E5BD